MTFMTNIDVKTQTTDRIITLKLKEGADAKSVTGLTDPRLFKGENKLIAFVDPVTMLWRVKYQFGIIPEDFKRSWTKFNLLLAHVTDYYAKRNIEIDKVEYASAA